MVDTTDRRIHDCERAIASLEHKTWLAVMAQAFINGALVALVILLS